MTETGAKAELMETERPDIELLHQLMDEIMDEIEGEESMVRRTNMRDGAWILIKVDRYLCEVGPV